MLIEVFRMVQGPYSLVYLNGHTKELYFIRDSLGRQTLLMGHNDGHLWLTSVAKNISADMKFIELPPLGLYRIQLDKVDSVDLFPWQEINSHDLYSQQLMDVQSCLGIPVNVQKDWIIPRWLGLAKETSEVKAYYFNNTLRQN